MASPLPNALLSLRIVSNDYYMSVPKRGLDVLHSNFNNRPIQLVPIIRVFGSTPVGQKVLLHLHRAFPYFFVEYDTKFGTDQQAIQQHIMQLAASIESAMEVATKRKLVQYIHHIVVTKGHHFYGYHANESVFLKIYM
jgi:DNA polymerase zeta